VLYKKSWQCTVGNDTRKFFMQHLGIISVYSNPLRVYIEHHTNIQEATIMSSRNAMLGTILLGTAAYLFRNKEARDNTLSKIQSFVKPETREMLSNRFKNFAKTNNSGTSYEQNPLRSTPSTGTTTYHEHSLLGTDFAQKDEDDAHSLAEAPKYL
jgi:hypothetical protein